MIKRKSSLNMFLFFTCLILVSKLALILTLKTNANTKNKNTKISNNLIYEIVMKSNGMCVTSNGQKGMILEKCDGSSKQLWTKTQKEDAYEIKSILNNMVFNNFNCKKVNNNPIENWPINNSPAQRYLDIPTDSKEGYVQLINKQSKKCLTHNPNNKTNPIVQFTCDPKNDSQLISFKLFILPKPTPPEPLPNHDITIKGYIKNSINNLPIKDSELYDAKITLLNAETGKLYTAVIQYSLYSVTLPIGKYTFIFNSAKFIEFSNAVEYTNSSDETNQLNNIFLSNIIKGYRIILTWGEIPKDIDLTVETSDGEKIYFKYVKSDDGNIALDVDNRNGFGPETITIGKIQDLLYIYVERRSKEALLSNSKAKVVIIHDSKIIYSFEVPKGELDESKNIWYVGILQKNNTFTPINQIVSQIEKI